MTSISHYIAPFTNELIFKAQSSQHLLEIPVGTLDIESERKSVKFIVADIEFLLDLECVSHKFQLDESVICHSADIKALLETRLKNIHRIHRHATHLLSTEIASCVAAIEKNRVFYQGSCKYLRGESPRALLFNGNQVFIRLNKRKMNDSPYPDGSTAKISTCIDYDTGENHVIKSFSLNHAELFENEVRILNHLGTSHFIANIEFSAVVDGKDRKKGLIGLEKCDLDLFGLIESNEALSEMNKLGIALCILKGMYHLKQKGVIHSDIKPENIFLSRLDRNTLTAKIGDFGLSFLQTDALVRNGITPHFVSPEYAQTIIKGEVTRSFQHGYFSNDMWALGCTLYFLMYGDYPSWINQDDPVDVIYQKLSEFRTVEYPEKQVPLTNINDDPIAHLLMDLFNYGPSIESVLKNYESIILNRYKLLKKSLV